MRFTLSQSTLPAALLARVMALLLMAVAVVGAAAGFVPAATAGDGYSAPALTVTDVGFATLASTGRQRGVQKLSAAPHVAKLRRRQSPVFAAIQVPSESHRALLAFQRMAPDVDLGAQCWDRVSCSGFPGDARACRSGSSRAPPALS
jgi:hypothetical protein